jgi:hypothetical protein
LTNWIRLYVLVEGQTERVFAETVLKPHLAQFQVGLSAILVTTNRKLNSRGGLLRYAHVKQDLGRRMRQDSGPEAYFTTMFDFYGLPSDFPGWVEARRQKAALARVAALEDGLRQDFGEGRFIPYIQLHEFEALLYCDLSQLERLVTGGERPLAALAQEVNGLEPEEINEGETTAPSKRLVRYLPLYEKQKVRVGADAAAAIGLPILRAKCPHFNDWVTKLERLSQSV